MRFFIGGPRAAGANPKISRQVHSNDAYSYLLACLTAASCRKYVETSLWSQVNELQRVSSPRTAAALEQFARSAFMNRRALVWPAQAAGMARLRRNDSFVLCTPTGSGKTTVATMGIVQALFSAAPPVAPGFANFELGNLGRHDVADRVVIRGAQRHIVVGLVGLGPVAEIVGFRHMRVSFQGAEKGDELRAAS